MKYVKSFVNKDVLKVVQPPKILEANLHDKIYYNLGREKWEYVISDVNKIAIDPNYPSDLDLARESAKSDSRNQVLLDTIKEEGLARIRMRWEDGKREALQARLGSIRVPEFEEGY
jgi:hypothetical protein